MTSPADFLTFMSATRTYRDALAAWRGAHPSEATATDRIQDAAAAGRAIALIDVRGNGPDMANIRLRECVVTPAGHPLSPWDVCGLIEGLHFFLA